MKKRRAGMLIPLGLRETPDRENEGGRSGCGPRSQDDPRVTLQHIAQPGPFKVLSLSQVL